MTTEQPPEAVPDEMEKLKVELAEFKDKYFRALAETENTRKRLQKEKIESQSYAIQDVVLDFLQPLDHFEQALNASQNASDDVKHWAIGFRMILQQLKQVIQDNGISTYEAVGEMFDPHLHEAIETEETTAFSEGTVTQEFTRGYKMGTRVIRPAKVKVATAPKEK
ncbi:MAG: nucleotide exchange factor GrpE [Verrucomicrobia bacterium]|nr:nucleotide exchange factor GrpE [Verrucomicrobiota bacterium]MBS0636666.1 nucleotide exchange factor GrpE [Verrucomicrobiota bacterium]